MARTPFVFFKRGRKEYVQFWDDEKGGYLSARSTGAENENDALKVVMEWIRAGGPPPARKSIKKKHGFQMTACGYLTDFWKDDSPYIVGRRARGATISEMYRKNNESFIRRLFTPRFDEKLPLSRLKTAELETWIMALYQEGIGPRTVNATLQAVSVALREAARLGLIPFSPAVGVRPVKDAPIPRGTLTVAEVAKLLKDEIADIQVKAAALLGCLCGLRLGEIRGLQCQDVDFENGIIKVSHNLPNSEKTAKGLKIPKWGSSREVPAPEEVLNVLRLIIGERDSGFVFSNPRDDGPIFPKAAPEGFESMLRDIGITEEIQKARKIVFHSLRHTYVSLSRGAGVPDFVVQRIAGHKTMGMTDKYSHATPEDIQNAKHLVTVMFQKAQEQSDGRKEAVNT